MSNFELKEGQLFMALTPIQTRDARTHNIIQLTVYDNLLLRAKHSTGLLTFSSTFRSYLFTLTCTEFTELLDRGDIICTSGCTRDCAAQPVLDTPKTNGSNEICHFCGGETVPMFGMLRVCPKCKK
jgi:hypothetical protein